MKNKMLILLAAAVIVVGIAAFLFLRSGKKDYVTKEVTLKLNLKPGQSIKLRRTQRVDLKGEGFMGVTIDYKLELDYTIACKEVKPDGTMFVEQRWDAARMEGTGRKGDISWDSSKGAQLVPYQARLYSKLVCESIELEVKPSGEVVQTFGLEAIADAMLYKEGIRPGFEATNEEYRNLQKMKVAELENSLEYVLDPIIDGYPEQPIQPGETLERMDTGIITGVQGSGMKLIYKGLYGQNADFEVTTTVTGSAGSPEKERTFDVDRQEQRQGKGEIEVDAETGLIVGAEVTFDCKISSTNEFLWQPELRKKETLEGKIATIIKRL